jgi:Protein of unknown function (DUF2867)
MTPGHRVRPLDPTDHLRRPWRVHPLVAAEGLSLRDVWQVDAALPPGVTLAEWIEALRAERLGGPARGLFWLRRVLGRLLRLDPSAAGLRTVYREPEEHLLRIENRTVTALLHLSVADRRPRLAVYVRPRGWLGRIYLHAIEPFRRHLVYPALLEAGRRAALRLGTRG